MPYARDPLSVAYDAQILAYLEAGDFAGLPGGGRVYPPTIVGSAANVSDGIAGSARTADERAWERSLRYNIGKMAPAIRYADARGRSRSRPAVSVRVDWGGVSRPAMRIYGYAVARTVQVRVFPYAGQVPAGGYAHGGQPRSDERSERIQGPRMSVQ